MRTELNKLRGARSHKKQLSEQEQPSPIEPIRLGRGQCGSQHGEGVRLVQAMSVSQCERKLRDLERIEAALQRMDEGDYGYCVSCGDEIDLNRLNGDPATPYCRTCAK